jgi:hypothetical protein
MSHARAFPQAVALMDLSRDAQIWTYADMARAAERLAAVWQDQGLQPGDRVAILLPQCAEALIAHFAAHLIGAVSLPLFVLFGPDALRFRLKDSGAKILVSDQAQYPKICEIQPELPDLDKVYLRDGASGLADGLWGAIEAQDAPYRPIQTRAGRPCHDDLYLWHDRKSKRRFACASLPFRAFAVLGAVICGFSQWSRYRVDAGGLGLDWWSDGYGDPVFLFSRAARGQTLRAIYRWCGFRFDP